MVRIWILLFVLLALPRISYASDFDKAIQIILKHEGKLVNDKHDRGGITNYGVSLRYVEGLMKSGTVAISEFDFNRDGKVDGLDIADMNLDEAKAIYKKKWWNLYGYGKINDQKIATKVFDLAVNMGNKKAVKIIQESCNMLAYSDNKRFKNVKNNIKIDGILGKETVNFINSLDEGYEKKLIAKIRVNAANYYKYLAKKHPTYKKFLKGWLNRAFDKA